MRVEINAATLPFSLEELKAAFAPIAQSFNMDWDINDSAVPKRLSLWRAASLTVWQICSIDTMRGELACEIPCVYLEP